jgi:FkbM family methyltransferase
MPKPRTLNAIRTSKNALSSVLVTLILICIGYIAFFFWRLVARETKPHTPAHSAVIMTPVKTSEILYEIYEPMQDSGAFQAYLAQQIENPRRVPLIKTESKDSIYAMHDKTCQGNSMYRCKCLIHYTGSPDMFCMRLKTGAVAVTFDPKTDHIANIAQKHGNYLIDIQKIVLREIQSYSKGSVLHVIDIGANVGMFSLMLASLGHKVIAFEPFSGNFERFKLSIMANRFEERIAVHKLALGSHKSEAYILTEQGSRVMQSNGAVAASMSDPIVATMVKNLANTKFEKITTDTLDAFYLQAHIKFDNQTSTKVHILKIDVEGFESLVVSGGMEFFKEVRPKFIFMEMNAKLWNIRQNMPGWKSMSDVLIYFQELGYCARSEPKYAKDPFTPCAKIGDILSRDIIFTL